MFETFIKGQMSLERITCLEITQQKNANLVALSDISLMVHLTITLANDQLEAQIFNTFITLLYMYLFEAISCSSSGGQIVFVQHLVSSLSVRDRSVHRLRKNSKISFSTCAPDGHLPIVMIPDAILINMTSWGWARYCSKHVHVKDCNKCINNLCIKLDIS